MSRFFARSYIGLSAPISVTPSQDDQVDLTESLNTTES